MNERKDIINSLKSSYGERKKGFEKRIKYLNGMSILNLVGGLFSGGIVLITIILEPLGFEVFKWQKMGLLVLLSLGFVLRLSNDIWELKLLKHLKIIADKNNFDGIDKLNLELKSIIEKLNKRLKNNWFIIPLVIIICIFSMIQVIDEESNTFWIYVKIPVLLFYGIIISKFIIVNTKVTKNITEFEKHSS